MLAAEQKGQGHTCEGCHGPGSQHAEDPSVETAALLKAAARTSDGCLGCHTGKLSRTEWLHAGVKHDGVTCLDCHAATQHVLTAPAKKADKAAKKADKSAQPVKPEAKATPPAPKPFDHASFTRTPAAETCLSCHTAQRAELSLPSHHPVLEGRVTCTDCHAPHQPPSDRLKRDVCVRCHAAQRGPFINEHGAISGQLTDACLDCHNPHGAANQRLLKFNGRGLCLQCHADRATHYVGQNCASCHTAVHGSNSSELLFNK